jgi:hypothetical protein
MCHRRGTAIDRRSELADFAAEFAFAFGASALLLFCPQLLGGPLICRRGVEELVGLLCLERRDFGMVHEAENVPAPGPFKLTGNRTAVPAGLEARAGPTFGFDDRLALAITPALQVGLLALFAMAPPVANPPLDGAFHLFELFASPPPSGCGT